MTPDVVRRDWPWLPPLLFCGVLLLYALAVPLGLPLVTDAATVARGWSLQASAEASSSPGAAPLVVLWNRLFGFLPLGDVAVRANWAAVVSGALALALLCRLACEVLLDLRPPMQARTGLRDLTHEPVAAALAVLLVGLCLGFFRAATVASATAPTVALVAGAWIVALRIARAPQDGRAGMTLLLLCGLAAGADPVAALLLWPPAALLWASALRRGERWPLVAPVLLVAGFAVLLVPAARSAVPVHAHDLVRRIFLSEARASWGIFSVEGLSGVLKEGCEQVGVVGLLIGAVGFVVLLTRAPFAFAMAAASLSVSLLSAAANVGGRAVVGIQGAAFSLALSAIALPLAVGAAFLSGKLGLARLPVAVVLAVTALVAPVLDGGRARWAPDARLPARLMERALKESPLRSQVDPGTPQMDALFLYARALGLRPDLTFVPVGLRPPATRRR